MAIIFVPVEGVPDWAIEGHIVVCHYGVDRGRLQGFESRYLV